jgi:hypothetical protein
MAGWTNRGKYAYLNIVCRNSTEPTNFYIALVTSAAAPTADTNTLSELTEIAAGNGYSTGGYQLTRNATDFDTLTEDDASDLAKILLKDISWSASGGPIPASGNGARYAVFTDDNATVGSREVWHYWDLSSNRSVIDGNALTLQDLEMRIAES